MDDTSPAQRVIRYRLTAVIAERRIREIAVISDNIKWSTHALTRMGEREIIDNDVLRILRRGTIAGDPEETPRGERKCKMVLTLRGTRDAGVVVIILRRGGLLVKTVEWEDL